MESIVFHKSKISDTNIEPERYATKDINYSTYKDTAIAMGLLEHDSQIMDIFEEASTVMLPTQLKQVVAWFLGTKCLIVLSSKNV
ncbi:hypothetical protein TSAR_009988 [Trichomalopsis sarcophagae]|uniref:Uncharacterized protein n=1 Tax=Trichomalopsis sarcophagae TaxID=543379 RepID=A0A232FCA0_9HYME|nr:hypothetical protein TSAR_009988 [Trichomalopsis sarcophagae]